MNESTASTASDKDKPVHKWPIRPGVHVHVNGLHVLNNSNASETKISGFSYGARNNSTTASDTNLDKDRTGLDGLQQLEDETSRNNTVARGTSTSDMMRHNETMASAQNNSAGGHGGQGTTSQACHAQAASAGLTASETGLVNNSNSFEFCMYYSKVDMDNSVEYLVFLYVFFEINEFNYLSYDWFMSFGQGVE